MRRADQRKFHYIYKITRNDGRYYIGMHSTDDMDDGYFGSGKLITRSIKKHGKERHTKEILEMLPTREALRLRETELVTDELLTDVLCMNLMLGGNGGWDHITPDQKRAGGRAAGKKTGKLNIVKTHTLECVERRARTFSARHLGQLGFAAGYKHSEKTKQAMSVSHEGVRNSQFGTCWVTNGTPIKIKKEQLGEYLANGYSRGRKIGQ